MSLIGLLYALRYGFEQVNRPHILEPLHDNTHYFQRQNQARGSWFAGTWQATLQPISISWPSFFFTDFRCDRRLLLAVFLTRTLSGSSSGFFLALDLVSSSMLHLYTVFYDLNSTSLSHVLGLRVYVPASCYWSTTGRTNYWHTLHGHHPQLPPKPRIERGVKL